jgi:hypothetical protein
MDVPPIEYLRECFEYDAETGLFLWRVRPERHFPKKCAWLSWNKRFADKRAFTNLNTSGQPVGRVSYKGRSINLCARRVAWALSYGRYPENVLHPINACASDNRLDNLREMTQAQCKWLARLPKRALPCGVVRSGKRFVARIRTGAEDNYLCTFGTPEEAGAAWQAAARTSRGQLLRCS